MAKILDIRERALESRDAIELLSNKWRIAVLHLLTPGPLRTGELQRALDDVSPKVLTQTLRSMERDGLIEREIFPVVPPRVEYRLTDMGASVLAPLQELCHWARANGAKREAARRRFDSGAAAIAAAPRAGPSPNRVLPKRVGPQRDAAR
jgi:DNA-binding HxlR family transcriptional regulator